MRGMGCENIRALCFLFLAAAFSAGCAAPAVNTGSQTTNSNISSANSTATAVNSNTNSTSTIEMAREPEQYQGTVKLSLETIGGTQKASIPTLAAVVARSASDRMMEFTLPSGEKVTYLDKGGINYVILPARRQYAELTKEALGFEVRRFLMPEQIVNQVKTIPGVRLVGEEVMNGRPVVRYAYSGTANTQTQAGTVATESFVLVDKETGLPVRSETVSQSQSGGNVQGYSGLRIVTEMTDIKTTPDAGIFTVPSEFQKIDPEQVKAQTTLIFNAIGAVIGQMINQPGTSPPATPVR